MGRKPFAFDARDAADVMRRRGPMTAEALAAAMGWRTKRGKWAGKPDVARAKRTLEAIARKAET